MGGFLVRLVEWDREFKVWAYGFSYSRLLLRSEPRFDSDERIEILFSNVQHMNISAEMANLKIDRVELREEFEAIGIGVPPEPHFAFSLNSGAGYVIATQCDWHADREWIDAPSHFAPFRGVK
ncbi:hypothetical protein [Streptacidiphilus sp. MAP5-3]|uniref:hypothetical protein n=1 Tax=unclassified Streptacidiphilus TaxID=2643834 RepID=UPI003511B162